MTKDKLQVKVYNNIALATGRGKNKDTWQGQPVQSDEWITDAYRKENYKLVCVLTHLTPVTQK